MSSWVVIHITECIQCIVVNLDLIIWIPKYVKINPGFKTKKENGLIDLLHTGPIPVCNALFVSTAISVTYVVHESFISEVDFFSFGLQAYFIMMYGMYTR